MHFVVMAITFLASFLAQIFTRSVSVVFEVLTKKLLVIGAVLVALTAIVAAFYLLISGILSGLAAISPAYLPQACSLVVPDNFTTLMSIKITAHLARWAYEWNIKVLQWRL